MLQKKRKKRKKKENANMLRVLENPAALLLLTLRLALRQSRLPRFLENPATISKGSVSCTGNQFCGQSKINTKGNTVEYAGLPQQSRNRALIQA
jgi:hypothetical protein